MPANAVVNQVGGVDSKALKLVPYFPFGEIADAYKAGPFWTCERIDLSVGPEPSTATCRIPLASGKDERAPSVSAVRGGPLDSIKVGTTGVIRAINSADEYSTVFRGSVTKISHEFDAGTDYALVQMSDARWLLQGVPIVGSYWGLQEEYPVWRPGWAAIPNQYGEPNAIYSEVSNCFLFCEPRYGLSAGAEPADPHEFNIVEACYWEPWMLVGHLRYLLQNADRTNFPEAGRLPTGIIWPEGLADVLDIDRSHRCREESLLGKNVADALHDLADQVGGYGLSVDFSTEDSPTLSFVRTRYSLADDNNGPGLYVLRPVSGNDLGEPNITVAGSLVEDGTNLFTRVTVAGAYEMIERRVSTESGEGLLRAWTDADKAALSGAINAALLSGKKPEVAISEAIRNYPDVFAAIKIDPQYRFWSGISEYAGGAHSTVSRPILGTLLTSYLSDSSADAKAQSRMPITWEYQQDGASTWLLADADDMSIDVRGIIRSNKLRDTTILGATYSTPAFTCKLKADYKSGLDYITGNELRATVAIPHDMRIAHTIRHPADANADGAAPVDEVDADRVASHTGRQAYIMAGKDVEFDAASGTFRKEYRVESWPVPETCSNSSVQGDSATPYISDATNIAKAAERRAQKYMRLKRGGEITIPRLSSNWRVGMVINGIEYNGGRWPLRSVVTAVRWNNTPGRQYTILGFG